MSAEPTREELVELCTRGVVLHERWRNRDTSACQRQLGEARALLAAGCPFHIIRGDGRLASNAQVWWVDIEFHGFDHFEYGGGYDDSDEFYIPTAERLDAVNGEDWYC